jgi:hypothetical protein
MYSNQPQDVLSCAVQQGFGSASFGGPNDPPTQILFNDAAVELNSASIVLVFAQKNGFPFAQFFGGNPPEGVSLTGPVFSNPVQEGGLPVSGCSLFPQGAYSVYNDKVVHTPINSNSANWIATYPTNLHANFGYATGTGFPWNIVPEDQPMVPVTFTTYKNQSNPGPYPMPNPDDALFEGPNGGADHHCIVLQQGTCMLYELGKCYYTDGAWTATIGAVFNTKIGQQRQAGVTSAAAYGGPILPGLIGSAEVQAGVIKHALRIVIQEPTYFGWITPGSHWNDEYTNPNYMPMGARLRLRTSALAGLTGQALIIATCLTQYGAIVGDVGPSGFQLDGQTDDAFWVKDDLAQLNAISVSQFDVLDTGPVVKGP